MAAFKSLIQPECGTINPLIKLSQLYTQDGLIASSRDNLTNLNRIDNSNLTIDEFVNEYHRPVAAPNTFHLDDLLTGLRLSDETVNKTEYEWAKQFLDIPSHSATNHLSSSSIHPSTNQQYSQWNQQDYIPPSSPFVPYPNFHFLHQQPATIDACFNNDIVQAAQNIFSLLQETQSAVDIDMNGERSDVDAKINDYSTIETNTQRNNEGKWQRDSAVRMDDYSEYRFIKINPFLDHTNPFEEGLQRLEVHDIVNAVLFFEAAVQKQSDHIEAWLYLGITQSENEQDGPAISALKKCVELDPKNLQGYIALSACYANEMLTNEALDSLRQWLSHNDKYSHLVSIRRTPSTTNNETRAMNQLVFEELQNLFLQAVALSNNPNDIDCDLQVCLGILFYLSGDYNKAAECFYTAVLAKPNDALLWNKLGAALANGGQCEKAVDAYYHALTLSPGFVRARYNLGISCFNLNAYKQSVEHVLIALKQQSDGIGPQGTHVQMSENIWRTLATIISHMKRTDLEQCVAYRDLSRLLHEFQIE